ncbi:MAG: VOC family protein [Pseudomonadota bacterium]
MIANGTNPKAADIAYVRFRAPDLEVMRTFLQDFGLAVTEAKSPDGSPVLYSRGTDPYPYLHVVEQGESQFLGVGFRMETLEDLEALQQLEGASALETLSEPGGGKRVRFVDPQGIEVDGVFGQTADETATPAQREPLNFAEQRNRLGVPVRLEAGPSKVKRLGHCVLFVEDFRTSEAWYKERFGFVNSDEIYVEDESNLIGAFMRCDRGDVAVDHHTLFLFQGGTPGTLQHAAFEVNDWDDVMLGHDYLKKKEYKPNWGIGKHILGSQVFDYWYDPYGNNVEHFTDGDLFDANRPTARHSIDVVRAVQWGAEIPHG